MTNKTDLLTPVGRFVAGSIYDAQTTDAENKPLVIKTGVNAGQPRVEFYFAIAIAKGAEKHWSETPWGATIWQVGHIAFPHGQADNPHFAWKIQDGDSTIPNKAGRKNVDREGYPGHWVLNFSSGFAPNVYNEDGTKQIVEKDFVKLGDYIQVFGNVSGNDSSQQPGIYLNHGMVAFSRYGQRIILGTDPKAVGFGKSPIPAGALATPPDGRFNPQPTNANTAPPPHTAILTPPVPGARVMLPAANGATYESFIAQGWTDQLLIQHGYMQA